MLNRIDVKDFRLPNEIVLDPLGRINLIAGMNGVGKTATLDAIYSQCCRRFKPIIVGADSMFAMHHYDHPQAVDHFARVRSLGRLSEILDALRIVEPRLRDMDVLDWGGSLAIHAMMIGVGRAVPFALLGRGVRRMLNLFLAIACSPKGIVLIDEIENSLHYSVLAPLWKAIVEALRKNDVQLFASLQGWECLCEAESAVDCASGELMFHRLDRAGNGVSVTTCNQEMIANAIQFGVDLR